ncbi:DNA primase [Candidatus Kaiserbacteria bacterium RIFCSPHIGHO2_12_FULL_56_13]|uniref:DNA primase n=1 Tax=Candidatus Kaiserbacteria bacterium RIFCSPHIGHO2_12_FULL_56_13 TaxID=1798505 RepID=A0A1F6EEW0_9BACT|nr:MAG: DNA primase [Candidatus Kaiserbacteria bacterium RIFCSPHIGHO2_12_FULL_56_13]
MPRDTVAEIKHRLSIQEVVAPYVKLTKAGRSQKGLCPFHKEKTPSFHVSVDRGTFHCFGCGVGGDMFTFIEKIEGVDFRGALALLAEKAGVEIVYDPKARETSSRLEHLREAAARAEAFYTERLTPDSEAYRYARSRGLTPETIKSWRLGAAEDAWRLLLEHLTTQGFVLEELLAAGLIKEADGKPGTYYDRFRHRLMFPIRDTAGRTVAFTGRTLGASDEAKYLNSPETELYHKSQILFGLDRAKEAIRTRGFALLVEGQTDLLHAHQAGFTNTVALSGTAFTGEHARLLKRSSENLMLALDADSAGLTATNTSALAALAAGMQVKAVRLPLGKDPADVIQQDPKAFAESVRTALPVVDFFLHILVEREHDAHRLVLAAERIVLPLIRAVESPMEREHFIERAARALGLSNEAVRASLREAPREAPREDAGAPVEIVPPPRSHKQMRAEMLSAVVATYPTTPLAKRVAKEYSRITEAPHATEGVTDAALFKVEEVFGENPSEDAADELLHAFEVAHVREAYQEAVTTLRRSEHAGNATLMQQAHEKVAELSKRLAALTK